MNNRLMDTIERNRVVFAVMALIFILYIFSSNDIDGMVAQLIGRLIGLVIGFSIHEWAHAYVAVRLGDQTPRFQGRLTLDPRAHLDPIGLVFALIAGFGWARPVPVNPRAFYPNEQRGMLLVALAGPVSNLVIATAFGLVFRVMFAVLGAADGDVMLFFYRIWLTIVIFNIALFFFNLIPLSPLDGWKIMLGLLPPAESYRMSLYEQQSNVLLIILLIIGVVNENLSIIGIILRPLINFVYQLVTGL